MKFAPFVILLSMLTLPLGAHDGHDEVSILIGTVRNVEKDRLEIETLDQTTLQRKNVWILLDKKTQFRVSKRKVDRLELAFGDRVETAVRSEHGPRDTIELRAVQILFIEPKQPASSNR
jgi:hypothetical protein